MAPIKRSISFKLIYYNPMVFNLDLTDIYIKKISLVVECKTKFFFYCIGDKAHQKFSN